MTKILRHKLPVAVCSHYILGYRTDFKDLQNLDYVQQEMPCCILVVAVAQALEPAGYGAVLVALLGLRSHAERGQLTWADELPRYYDYNLIQALNGASNNYNLVVRHIGSADLCSCCGASLQLGHRQDKSTNKHAWASVSMAICFRVNGMDCSCLLYTSPSPRDRG
eukprot:4270793-Amphidinium_carterae.1